MKKSRLFAHTSLFTCAFAQAVIVDENEKLSALEKDAIAFWIPVIAIFIVSILLSCLVCCGVIGKKYDWHNIYGCFEEKQKQKKKKVRAFEDRDDPSPLDQPRTYRQAGPFSYECKRCRSKQTITHPLYRY